MTRGPMNLRLLPYTPARDVYRLLDVPPSASSDEINAACRRLARTFHPDRNGSSRATEEMQIVNAVRRVMTDPESRALYDRERSRFQAALSRPREARVPVSPTPSPRHVSSPRPPAPVRPRSRSTVGVYARALAAGVRVTLTELAPSRCRSCRIVIEASDSYCAACGIPLLTGG
jgi:curved DNA-binding protein CbpA